jgi:antitoxin (DNA-binding transcriptional repressor) of toxin-antitoxin stability system
MKNTITATELVRGLGDVLARIRYRRESFIVERNGRAVARMVPVDGEPTSVREALEAWLLDADADADASFADDLARVNAADRPAANPWAS